MAFDLASILGLPPGMLPQSPFSTDAPGGPDPTVSSPFNWASPQMVALAQANAPTWSGGAPQAPGAPAAAPAPDAPAPAPQDPRMLAQPGPAGNLTAADLTPPRPDAPWYKRFIGNMAANGGASPEAVMDFKDPTYRDRVSQYRSAEAQKLFPNDPVGQALWAQGDPDIRKAMAKNEEIRGDAPDNTVSRNGKPLFTTAPAPKQGVDGDQGWTWDAKNGFQWGAARQPSYAEQTQAKEAAIKGMEADDKISRTTANEQEGAVLKKALSGNALSDAEKAVLKTWAEGKVKPAFGSPDDKPPGENVWGEGAAAPKAPAAPAAGQPPAADGFTPPNPAQYQDGSAYRIPSKADGKIHVWRFKGGKLYDQGPAK